MDSQENFMIRLIRTFIEKGYIIQAGRSMWTLTLPGGVPIVDLAIGVLSTLASMGFSAIMSRIGYRLDEGNTVVRTVFEVLSQLGNLSLPVLVECIRRAVGFLQNLVQLAARALPGSRHRRLRNSL